MKLAFYSTLIAVATMTAYYSGLKTDAMTASTMAFATLTLARLFHGFTCRSERSVMKIGFTSNKWSIAAFATGVVLLAFVLFVPFMQSLFEVSTLSSMQILTIAGLAFIPTLIIQAVKMFKK